MNMVIYNTWHMKDHRGFNFNLPCHITIGVNTVLTDRTESFNGSKGLFGSKQITLLGKLFGALLIIFKGCCH